MIPDVGGFQLQGFEQVQARMKEVKALPRSKANRFALRKAANLVRDKVQENAKRLDDPKTANDISANVAVRFDNQVFRQTGDMMMRVGIRGGAASRQQNQRNPGGDTYYWRFLEFGTEKLAAQPFMRPGMEQSIEPATAEYITQYDKALVRAIKRANKAKAR